MKENKIVRELKDILGTKEEDIVKTLQRFKKDIENNTNTMKILE